MVSLVSVSSIVSNMATLATPANSAYNPERTPTSDRIYFSLDSGDRIAEGTDLTGKNHEHRSNQNLHPRRSLGDAGLQRRGTRRWQPRGEARERTFCLR